MGEDALNQKQENYGGIAGLVENIRRALINQIVRHQNIWDKARAPPGESFRLPSALASMLPALFARDLSGVSPRPLAPASHRFFAPFSSPK